VEVVVEADQLQLAVGVEQRLRVPQTDVREGRLVAFHGRLVERLRRRERSRLDRLQTIRAACHGNVVREVRPLQAELGGASPEALEDVGTTRGRTRGAEHKTPGSGR